MLTDADGNAKNDVPIPQDDIGTTIRDHLDKGDSCSKLFERFLSPRVLGLVS